MINDDGAAAETHREIGSVKILALLGIAQRAGFLTVGFDAVCSLAKEENLNGFKKRKPPEIILIADDISEKTEKEVNFHIKNVEIVRVPFTKEELSKSIGLKSLVGIIAVNDSGFVKAIKKHL